MLPVSTFDNDKLCADVRDTNVDEGEESGRVEE